MVSHHKNCLSRVGKDFNLSLYSSISASSFCAVLSVDKDGSIKYLACRLAEWVAFLHAVVIATVVMCRVRNPACTARERPRVGALYKW